VLGCVLVSAHGTRRRCSARPTTPTSPGYGRGLARARERSFYRNCFALCPGLLPAWVGL
jgi:hypothetical protein